MADETWSMEELTISNDEHGTPDEDMECMATMEDITTEDKNYCEYQTMPSGRWHKSKYAAGTVRRLITHQFPEYVDGVRKADCAADLKRRLAAGPPIYIADKHALPIPEEDTHIERLWFAEDGKEYSAKLKGCVEVRAPLRGARGCTHVCTGSCSLDPRSHAGGRQSYCRWSVLPVTSVLPLRFACLLPHQGAEREKLWEELKNFSPPEGWSKEDDSAPAQ